MGFAQKGPGGGQRGDDGSRGCCRQASTDGFTASHAARHPTPENPSQSGIEPYAAPSFSGNPRSRHSRKVGAAWFIV
jgi:hypothetical protein